MKGAETMKKYRIGVLTGGGDCAGLNSAVKWIVKTALDSRLEKERGVQYEVLGIRDGWKGLILPAPDKFDESQHICCLTENYVRTWDRLGGTNLGSSRTNPYNPKDNRVAEVKKNIEKLGLSAVIAIGGDDTLGVAGRLAAEGINVVGIPKTIDRDLPLTEYTLGYETALSVITEETDRLRTYAGSHKVVFVIETMGRHAGWLALEGGESAGVFIILIPEYKFSMDKVNELITEGVRTGNRYNIVMVAEGASPSGKSTFTTAKETDAFGHVYLGGIGQYVAEEIEKGTGLMTRSMALGYLQRGGAPCAYDRRMGRYFGIAAVDLIVQENFGQMVSYTSGKITSVPIVDIVGKTRLVDINTQYDTERLNGRRTIIR
jgi:ATP-dependent phosphofructokinase / diphosphate-dependent phosphofructokinase